MRARFYLFYCLFSALSGWGHPLLLDAAKTNCVESALEKISLAAPSLFSDFTLMQKSESLQDASSLSPRVIGFGKDARFLLAFNGDPKHKGYHALESLHFRSSLVEGMEVGEWILEEVLWNGKTATLSKPNPPKCLQCHGSIPRPIWEQYATWDGAYGKHDDAIIDFGPSGWPEKEPEIITEHRKDLKNLQDFLKQKEDSPRYQKLLIPTGSPVSPYSPERSGDRAFRPNLRLTESLTRLQAKHILGLLLKQEKCFPNYQELLLANLMNCTQEEPVRDELKNLNAFVVEKLKMKYPGRPEEERWITNGSRDYGVSSSILALLNVEKEDWHMGRSPESWSYFEGAFHLEQLVAVELLKLLSKKNPSLPTSLSYQEYLDAIYVGNVGSGNYFELTAACETLVKGAKKKMSKLEANGGTCKTSRPPVTAPLIQMCATCHASDTNAPKIDFDHPEKMSPSFKKKILDRITPEDGKSPMPPERWLNPRERQEIELFLDL